MHMNMIEAHGEASMKKTYQCCNGQEESAVVFHWNIAHEKKTMCLNDSVSTAFACSPLQQLECMHTPHSKMHTHAAVCLLGTSVRLICGSTYPTPLVAAVNTLAP
jgi:hypothetical protein